MADQSFTPKQLKTVAQECLTYAQRYRVSLTDAICEWEGENSRDDSFGLTPFEKRVTAEILHADGYDLDLVREPVDDGSGVHPSLKL